MPDVDDELVELAHDFAEREMRPQAARYDESGEFPWDIVHRAAELGLASYDLPEEYGGGGVSSLLTGARIIEELAWGHAPMAGCIGGGGFFAGPIVAMGDDAQKQRWVTPLCTERPPIGVLATTEPEVGSDAAAMTSHARRNETDDGYLLNGHKTWISNAPVADLYLVFATVAPGTRSKGITAFVLERAPHSERSTSDRRAPSRPTAGGGSRASRRASPRSPGGPSGPAACPVIPISRA